MKTLKVKLSAVGNIDHGENPDAPLPGVPQTWVEVKSLKAASRRCRAYIEQHDLGGGNWTGGKVVETRTGKDIKDKKATGKLKPTMEAVTIAQVSYNGRVWAPGNQLKSKEIKT